MRRTGPRQVVPVVLAGLLLAGCGTSPSAAPAESAPPGSPAALSEVVDATLGAGTARVQVRTRAGAGARVRAAGTTKGVVEFASGNRQLLVPLPFGSARVAVRLLDGVLYNELPPNARGPWGANGG